MLLHACSLHILQLSPTICYIKRVPLNNVKYDAKWYFLSIIEFSNIY